MPTSITCEPCGGSGAEAGSKPIQCPSCQGRGKIRAQQGFFTIERTCPTCQGAGHVIENPCKPCGGSGRVRREKSLAVNIPAGVEDGTRIRLSGEGEAGLRAGPPGDLYIFLSVSPHRFFEREGIDLKPVAFTAGMSVLGSDDGAVGFRTPLATLHKFNGWADLFLTTPGAGLQDTYLRLGYVRDAWTLSVRFHDFRADADWLSEGAVR